MPEFDIIRRYFQDKTPDNAMVRIGIGDDAAVLSLAADRELVVAVDTLVAGVHFPRDTPAFDIGYKALAVNLSDLAAMGATPRWMTLALTLPQADDAWLEAFSAGLFSLARPYHVALVGGDTTQGPLCISLQIGGEVESGRALRRSGARLGDAILVTGTLGDAARGLQLLQQGNANIAAEYRARLNRPRPRVEAGQVLLDYASACIDISDGLYADLAHITAASGVGAHIELAQLPLSTTLKADALPVADKYRLALGGGDDYELCFTVGAEQCATVQALLADIDVPASVIGHITMSTGITLHSTEGSEIAVDTLGYEHFT
ncbi:MAG: thiamine-phosphate kinase [Gammaproteobacteria bacterium]